MEYGGAIGGSTFRLTFTRYLVFLMNTYTLRLVFGLALLLTLGPAGRTFGQAPAWAWANSPEYAQIHSLVTDSVGNSYLAGSFSGTVTLGGITLVSNGSYADVFVAKLTPGGSYQWAVRAGGDRSEQPAALALDRAGNVYVAGNFESPTLQIGTTTLTNSLVTSPPQQDVFVGQLSPTGVWQWATSAGGDEREEVTDMAVDGAGRVVVSGRFFSDTVAFGALTAVRRTSSAYTSAFVAQLVPRHPAGPWQWVRTPAGDSTSGFAIKALAVDAAGNISLGGEYLGDDVTFGTTTLPATTVVTGPSPGNQNFDVFVARLDAAGVWQWARSGSGLSTESIVDLALDAAGNVLVCGRFTDHFTIAGTTLPGNNSAEMYVAKLSSAGTWAWATPSGGSNLENCSGLSVGPGGEVYVGGAYAGVGCALGPLALPAFGTLDAYVARLSSAGAWEWAVTLGSPGIETIHKLAVVRANQLVVTGGFNNSTLAFGATTLTANPGYNRAFVARLDVVTGLGGPAPAPTSLFTLAPNPAHRSVRLTGTAAPTATLLDGFGRTVRTWRVPASGALDLSGLAPGLYTVRAGSQARRLVVE